MTTHFQKLTEPSGRVLIEDPPLARLFFQSTATSWLWLLVRLWVGYQWVDAGWEKFTSAAWMGPSGAGIVGFWNNALGTTPSGGPVTVYGWYRDFIQLLVNTHAEVWFAKVIVFGELAVGLGLILGAFVGIAATGGLLMNLAYLLAGTVSINPALAVLQILLILAWKNAGFFGLDRVLLPLLGTPWRQPALHTAQERVAPRSASSTLAG